MFIETKLLLFFTKTFFLPSTFLYIDPGSWSAIIAMIISAIAGFGITIKLYWEKFKAKLSPKKHD